MLWFIRKAWIFATALEKNYEEIEILEEQSDDAAEQPVVHEQPKEPLGLTESGQRFEPEAYL